MPGEPAGKDRIVRDTPSNTDDIIDSRDIIARIEELEEAEMASQDEETPIPMEEEEAKELKILRALAEEAEGYASDWKYGEVLIRDSYFREYAEQLADDIGAIPPDADWPLTCIDWEQAARELQQDYTSIDFDGETYWIR